jgi:hypothetical protein
LAGAFGLLPANDGSHTNRSLSHDRYRVSRSVFLDVGPIPTPICVCYPVLLKMLPEDNID